jgi:RimJ/RimL family protein N-acetyltransferase
MEFMPGLLDRAASDAFVERIEQHFTQHGFGLWAVEVIEGMEAGRGPAASAGAFIGYVGLMRPRFTAAFTPCVEVGWRLARAAWGRGYATEAAREACRVGFDEVGLSEIVSFTVPANVRSRRVMERLGMTHDPAEDFDHPLLPDGHALRRHVLYRLSRERWSGQRRLDRDQT